MNKIIQFFKKGASNIYNKAKSFVSGLWNDYTGKTVNEQNLDFQRENLDYQKALQQQQFGREDSTYQRTVDDMRLAGLNPLSMNGLNASGESIATSPMESQKTSDIQAINQILDVMNQVSVTRNNSTLTNAQANLINAQAQNQKIKNIYENDILGKTLESLDFDNIGKRFENQRKNIAWQQDLRNLAFNEQFGLSENMGDFAKLINYMTHQGSLSENWYKNQMPDSWENFGKYYTHNDDYSNFDFSSLQSVLEKSNLKGALQENVIGNALLKLIGIY